MNSLDFVSLFHLLVTLIIKNNLIEARISHRNISIKNCGIKLNNYIAGGTEAIPHEFPFMVYISFGSISCGGVIINEWWVLTAAHCFKVFKHVSQHISEFELRTGSHHSSSGDVYKISRLVIHLKLKLPEARNDLALIRVERKIRFNTNVNAICLPTKPYSEPYGVLTLAGWGYQHSKQYDPHLHKVNVDYISDEKCAKMVEEDDNHFILKNRPYLCTLGIGKEGCSGDSGGPVFHYVNGRAVLVGIMTGSYCDKFHGLPTISQQVSYYLDWIYFNIYF